MGHSPGETSGSHGRSGCSSLKQGCIGKVEQDGLGEMPYIVLEASKACGGVFVLHLFTLVQKRALLGEKWLGKGRHCALKEMFFNTSVGKEKK